MDGVRPSAIGEGLDFALIVGTITPRKNVMGMIKAYEAISSETDLKLIFVGGYEWKSNAVLEYVDKKGLSEKIIFTGYISDGELSWCYKNASMLLYCSFYEGFGFPPLEAMAAETPVIASNVSAIPEIVGDAALLVDPYDICKIGEAILLLEKDLEARNRIVGLGKNRFKEFTWEKAAKETHSLFMRELGIEEIGEKND
jgi:glycosyltransferase involved in cell wall biosynthesis